MQNEEVRRLEADLESKKEEIREDLTTLEEKVRVTRDELRPSKLIGDRALLFSGVAILIGLVLGYGNSQVVTILKPAARSVLNAAGREAAARAFRS